MSTEAARLLIIDDDTDLGRILASRLETYGHEVVVTADGAHALSIYDDISPEVVIVDLWMTGLSGMEVLTQIRRRDAAASIILLSGNVDVRTTVRALRAGAEDVQTKPVDYDLLNAAIERGLQRTRLMRAHRVASTQVSDPYGFFDDSPPMRLVTRLVERLSQSAAPVLIVGEAGTGKGTVAEMLHQLSPRAERPFVRVARAGLTPELLAMAAGGTLFLESVAGLEPRAQELLLGALGAGGMGSAGAIPAVRVVAATERDLAQNVRSGSLRADLYQRLAVHQLAVPSLRARGDEALRYLALRFVHAQRFSIGRGPSRIAEEAHALLSSLSWPGNVRQLREVIEESFIVALDAEALEPVHLRDVLDRTGLEPAAGAARGDERSLEEVERRHIARVLAQVKGHRTEAARILGITRTTLYKKMHGYGLEGVGGE